MSEALGKHVKPITCDICYTPVTTDIVGLTCCGMLIHGECININANYFTHSCPHCDHYYAVDTENPVLTYVMEHYSPADIIQLYHDLYHDDPKMLRQVDREVRRKLPRLTYLAKFTGYFDYAEICSDHQGISIFQESWDNFSYGIFRGYDWAHTFATGRAVATMFNGGTPLDNDHIYVVIYGSDYRVVRRQLSILFTHLEGKLGTPLIHLEDGILILFFSCLVRKICIYVEHNADPHWFIFQKREKFGAYGTIYDGNTVLCTIKALVAPQEYRVTEECNVLGNVMGNETEEHFMKRINRPLMVGTKYVLENIYRDYTVKISHGINVDPLKKKWLVALVANLQDIIDVRYVADADTEDIGVIMETGTQSQRITTTIMAEKTVRKAILRELYQQHVSII